VRPANEILTVLQVRVVCQQVTRRSARGSLFALRQQRKTTRAGSALGLRPQVPAMRHRPAQVSMTDAPSAEKSVVSRVATANVRVEAIGAI